MYKEILNLIQEANHMWIVNTRIYTFYNILVPILADDLLTTPELLKIERL